MLLQAKTFLQSSREIPPARPKQGTKTRCNTTSANKGLTKYKQERDYEFGLHNHSLADSCCRIEGAGAWKSYHFLAETKCLNKCVFLCCCTCMEGVQSVPISSSWFCECEKKRNAHNFVCTPNTMALFSHQYIHIFKPGSSSVLALFLFGAALQEYFGLSEMVV